MAEESFVINMHYGGIFMTTGDAGGSTYVGGSTYSQRDVDPDLMYYVEIMGIVKEIGFPASAIVWFKMPHKHQLKLLEDDKMVLQMFKLYGATKVYEIDMYVDNVNIDVDLSFGGDDLGVDTGDLGVGSGDYGVGIGEDVGSGDYWVGTGDLGVENADHEEEGSTESDPNYNGSSESDESSDDDNLSDFDFFAEGDRLSDTCDPVCMDEVDMAQTNEGSEAQVDHEFHTEENNIQSDPEILSEPNESDEEDTGLKFPEFDDESEMKKPKLQVGLVFANSSMYRKALRQYAVRKGIQLKFEKNEKRRITAICKRKCGWRIHASLMRKSTAFQIKSFKGEPHKCPRNYVNKSANSTYLAHKYLEIFLEDPTMPIRSFKKRVRREVKVYAHRQKLYRAKRKAIEMIQGNIHEQYPKLRQYCHEILKTNPGSTAVLKVQGPPLYRHPRFQRIFVMFDAMKRGFLEGCRPVIGLDACFLKGPYGGQLMAAIGRDGNNQMFPLAFAVVEIECRESWSWFLELLMNAFGSADLGTYSFISDRQKGLVESFQILMPSTEHRFCVRHLYANFKLKFKDQALKNLMWSAARSYLEDGFNQKMNEIKAISKEAYEWLVKIAPNQWCKYALSTRPKCDMLSNNLCESFNNYIKEAREMPILTMCEALRRQLMCRIQTKRQWIENYNGKICPRIQEKLNIIKEKSLEFECLMAAEGLWEVTLRNKSWVVNFRNHTCSCREWDMTGIPCEHAICAILQEEKDAEDFVSNFYSVEKYKTTYKYIIMPVPDNSQWSEPSAHDKEEQLLPPVFKKKTGRPRKVRKKGLDEINIDGKLTRKGLIMSCSNCGDITHNTRRCEKPPPEHRMKTKKRGKAQVDAPVSQQASGPQVDTPSTQVSQSSVAPPLKASRAAPTSKASSAAPPSKSTRSRAKKRGNSYGPQCGLGNWNGIGMHNQFKPPKQVIY